MLADQERALRRGASVFPQPIAAACGHVLRARSEESLVDAVIKAAEVLARYLAAIGLASWAAREVDAEASPYNAQDLLGGLSFGVFVQVAEQLAGASVDHPLKQLLASSLVGKAKAQTQGKGATKIELSRLLELRNKLGHDISSLTRARAIAVLRDDRPVDHLVAALEGAHELLDLPLFVLEDQQLSKGQIRGRRLVLMGENPDPEPEEIVLAADLHSLGKPYLGTGRGAICLAPLLLWDIAQSSANYRLFMIDSIDAGRVKHKSVSSEEREHNGEEAKFTREYIASGRVPFELIQLKSGESLAAEWRARRKRVEAASQVRAGDIPWNDFEPDAIEWFAARLDPQSTGESLRALVTDRLLDGRSALAPRETAQLTLLFGTERAVRSLIQREMLDLRMSGNGGSRWEERIESHANVFHCLREAVGFFVRHVGIDGVTLEGLRSTSGTADYIAMREALVNLFIHQDYADASAAAQIELSRDRAVFFNPGRALVSKGALVEGGKSQARNPLIARALRLVGLAELAGSGLRELQRVWRGARRRPPRIESDDTANTFTLTLDWREVQDAYDAFWKDKIGVRISEREAQILNIALDPEGVSVEEAASATGARIEEANEAIRTLLRQVLVSEDGGRYRVSEHLRDLVRQ